MAQVWSCGKDRTALGTVPGHCPGSSRCAALMGVKGCCESTQTDTKPGFITVSTFDIDKGHSCPSLLCIFMHLWPQSIWLGWGIKLRYYKDGSSQKNQHQLLPPRGVAAPSSGFGEEEEDGGDHQRHLVPQRGSASSSPPSHHALAVLSGAFLKPSRLCVWHSPYPNSPVHLTFCNPWEVTSPWLSSPSPAAHEGKAEAICWCLCLMTRGAGRWQNGTVWAGVTPKSQGTHGLFLTASRTGGGI